jgi:hypothetical protein
LQIPVRLNIDAVAKGEAVADCRRSSQATTAMRFRRLSSVRSPIRRSNSDQARPLSG